MGSGRSAGRGIRCPDTGPCGTGGVDAGVTKSCTDMAALGAFSVTTDAGVARFTSKMPVRLTAWIAAIVNVLASSASLGRLAVWRHDFQ